jgi:hypothetical protein
MNQKLIDKFERCMELLEAGVPLEDCGKEYPDLEPELRKILETAKDVMQFSEEKVSIESMNRSRIKLLSKANQLASKGKENTSASGLNWIVKPVRRIVNGFYSLSPLAARLVLVVAITGMLILFSSGLVITSAKSLPGDSLYPVKRAVEDISIHLVPNSEVRGEYENNYSQQRVVEVKRLIELKRIQRISFEGILESTDSSNWIVSGIPVDINAATTAVVGPDKTQSFQPGSVVEIEGITNVLGGVTANEIHLREYEFIGTVDKIEAKYWQISGIQYLITSWTQIDVGIREGDDVTVLVRSADNGLQALAILLDVHPIVTTIAPQPNLSTPMPTDTPSVNTEEEHQISGILENISGNYWVVNGQIIYIVADTDISDGINIGDSVSVDYKVEGNGSYTGIEINIMEKSEQPDEYQPQETPESGDEDDDHEASIETTEVKHEIEESTSIPEHQEPPESTEDHLVIP